MIEAVGEQFWPGYFSQLHDRLRPGGPAGLQAITIQESLQDLSPRSRFHSALRFPGRHAALAADPENAGEVGVPVIRELFSGKICQDACDLAKQFPRGLAEPDAVRLRRSLPAVWEYYLAYCEAGFRRANRRASGGVCEIGLTTLFNRWLVRPAAVD